MYHKTRKLCIEYAQAFVARVWMLQPHLWAYMKFLPINSSIKTKHNIMPTSILLTSTHPHMHIHEVQSIKKVTSERIWHQMSISSNFDSPCQSAFFCKSLAKVIFDALVARSPCMSRINPNCVHCFSWSNLPRVQLCDLWTGSCATQNHVPSAPIKFKDLF